MAAEYPWRKAEVMSTARFSKAFVDGGEEMGDLQLIRVESSLIKRSGSSVSGLCL